MTSRYVKDRFDNGCFIECGVKQGTSACIIGTETGKKGFLFDTWKGFPNYSELDAPTPSRKKRLERRIKNNISTKKDCKEMLKKNGLRKQCKMIQGDICETVPNFVHNPDNLGLKVAFMHVDTDLHDPAQTSFDCFWPNLVDGGLIFVHDVDDRKWKGIRVAVDRLVSERNVPLFIFPPEDFHAAIIFKGGHEDLEAFNKYYQENNSYGH